MENIKVGEYVRTKSQGIFRISHINPDNIINEFSKVCLTQNEKVGWGSIEAIKELKHSPNIIDLIEVGDYINYYRVEEIGETHIDKVKYLIDSLDRSIYDENIASILTHEQFESMKYILGGKEEWVKVM